MQLPAKQRLKLRDHQIKLVIIAPRSPLWPKKTKENSTKQRILEQALALKEQELAQAKKRCEELEEKLREGERKWMESERKAESFKKKYEEKVTRDKVTKSKLQKWIIEAKSDLDGVAQ